MKLKPIFTLPTFLLLACSFSVSIVPSATDTPSNTTVPPTTTFTSINTEAPLTLTDTPTNTAIPPTVAFTTINTMESPTATYTPTPKPTIPPGALGMIVRGHVTVNGVGLAGVEIYQNFAAYPAHLVAVTDGNGYYETWFIGIPSDEMIGLEPRLDGYTFDPPYHSWRHYHGYAEYTWDFSAVPAP